MKRGIVTVFHRWCGLVGGVCGLLWCLSGMVMLFVPYPQWTDAQRLERLPAVQWEHCCPSLKQLWGIVPSGRKIMRIRVIMTAGRVRVIAEDGDGTLFLISGDGRQEVAQNNSKMFSSELQSYGRSAIVEPIVRDQWTIQEQYGPHRPLWKVSLHDQAQRELYLSSKTGEVLLQTTAWERGWNWIGAVVHWAYLPDWREHVRVWAQTLSWLASIAVIGIGTGLWVGARSFRRASNGRWLSPYQGWWQWHHRIGLCIGGVVLMWAVSGYLTLDEGQVFSLPSPSEAQREQFMGSAIQPEDFDLPFEKAWEHIQPAPPVRELLIVKVHETVHYVFRHNARQQTVVPIGQDRQAGLEQIPTWRLVRGAEFAMGARVVQEEWVEKADRYYYPTLHHPRPLPVLRLVFDDPAETWLYLDPGTGQMIEMMDRSRRLYRWLVSGFHTWDVGWFQEWQGLRKGWILFCSCMGVGLIVTGLWIGLGRFWGWISES